MALLSSPPSYPIQNGIPYFIENVNDQTQQQVQESFGEKWTQSDFGHACFVEKNSTIA